MAYYQGCLGITCHQVPADVRGHRVLTAGLVLLVAEDVEHDDGARSKCSQQVVGDSGGSDRSPKLSELQ